jgi:hypothetical protein
MIYSYLVDYVKLSPNKTNPRSKKICKITVHHAAAVTTLEALAALFADPKRQASANYGIDSQGRIACFVEEEMRPWTSGDRDNDMQAITIEMINSAGGPEWPVSEKAWKALVELCADICKRYDFRLEFTGDKTGSLTIHKFFQPTACPGPYLEARMPKLAEEVNAALDAEETAEEVKVFYRVQVGAFLNRDLANALCKKLQDQGYKDAFIQTVKE